jgi:hypothetical protein
MKENLQPRLREAMLRSSGAILDLETVTIAVALGIGMLVGFERTSASKDGRHSDFWAYVLAWRGIGADLAWMGRYV